MTEGDEVHVREACIGSCYFHCADFEDPRPTIDQLTGMNQSCVESGAESKATRVALKMNPEAGAGNLTFGRCKMFDRLKKCLRNLSCVFFYHEQSFLPFPFKFICSDPEQAL